MFFSNILESHNVWLGRWWEALLTDNDLKALLALCCKLKTFCYSDFNKRVTFEETLQFLKPCQVGTSHGPPLLNDIWKRQTE